MPLVVSTTDGDFVKELSDSINGEASRLRDHTTAMVEEYLRRRLQEKEVEMRGEFAVTEKTWRAESDARAKELQHREEEVYHLKNALSRAAEAVALARDRQTAAFFFCAWLGHARRRAVMRVRAVSHQRHLEVLFASRAFAKWKLFLMLRHLEKQHVKERKGWRRREAALAAEVEEMQHEVSEEKRRNQEKGESLKAAFVRGMRAINREAVHALTGEGAERQASSIEEILTGGDSGLHHRGEGSSAVEFLSSQLPASPSGICPVHHRDETGHFYHRCFAPEKCPYNGGVVRETMGSPVTTRAPFVVRVDHVAARAFNAGPPTVLRPARAVKPTTRKT